MLYLYLEVQSTFSVLGDKIFQFIFFNLLFSKAKPEVSKTQTYFEPKNVLNDFFAHNLTSYHAKVTIFSNKL